MTLPWSFVKTTEQYKLNACLWTLCTPWVQQIKTKVQRRDSVETWWVDCRKILGPWPCTHPTPHLPCSLAAMKWATLRPHMPSCQDASPLTGSKALEPINRGLNTLKPWPQINLPSSVLSQAFCHSVTVIKLINTFIFWGTIHTVCHILRFHTYYMPHPKVLYILRVTFWNTLCFVCCVWG